MSAWHAVDYTAFFVPPKRHRAILTRGGRAYAERMLAEKRKRHSPALPKLRKQLKEAESSIENIMKAIKAGIFTPTTKEELEKAEAARKEPTSRLDDGARPTHKKPANEVLSQVSEVFARKVAELEKLTPEQMPELVKI